MPNTVILSPPRRAKNLSQAFVLNQEGFFASPRMTTRGLFPQTVQPRRKRCKVSHLRCSNFLWPPFPALPGWANFWRASGALALARPIRDLLIGAAGWGSANWRGRLGICEWEFVTPDWKLVVCSR